MLPAAEMLLLHFAGHRRVREMVLDVAKPLIESEGR